jgi:SWI/SNF chromatin-remodeling complex subunit SWI1
MSSWINEAAVPNHNGNGFPHINDPSAVAGSMMDPSAFMGNSAQFNAQFANPQQMVMPNGQMRNASPSFPNPMYQTNSVVPSKRPRPRDDNMGQSPRPAPGMLPASRAETPQQSAFAGFQQPGMPQQSSQPSPYPHLQPNGSTNATPSPIMANQMRPGSVPQRVASTSPHPFSPAAQQFPQASPIPTEHGGAPQSFMQQNAFPHNFNPQFNAAQSPASRCRFSTS